MICRSEFLCFLLLPLIAQCAKLEDISGRIVGGQSAASGQFPYQVSVQETERSHSCGGSIVSSTWILTSAYCTLDKEPGKTTILAGSHLITLGGTRYGIDKIVSHPDYNSKTFQNDIGMMRTDSLIIFTELIQPIKIALTEVATEVEAVASGWGILAYPGALANNLQYLLVTIIDNDTCQSLHTATNAAKLNAGSMCARPIRGTGMCAGDTGSPLVTETENAGVVQIGLVSWGVPCGANYPDVYTRLSKYTAWIGQVSDAFFIEKVEN
ncbi:hypothetical protein DMENIID0001_047400 [Sergentomyia squamirostris]